MNTLVPLVMWEIDTVLYCLYYLNRLACKVYVHNLATGVLTLLSRRLLSARPRKSSPSVYSDCLIQRFGVNF